MRTFLFGILAAVLVAAATGVALNGAQIPTASFNSTDNARL